VSNANRLLIKLNQGGQGPANCPAFTRWSSDRLPPLESRDRDAIIGL